MQFRDWFEDNFDFMEMGGIKDLDTSNINLQPKLADFDSYTARNQCRKKAEKEVYKGIPDKPENDPEFKEISPSAWLADNPEPEEVEALRKWNDDYSRISSKYYDEKETWNEKIRIKKEELRDKLQDAITSCVAELRAEHERTTPVRGYTYEFNIGDNEYLVNFDKLDGESPLSRYIGDVPGMYSVEFKGPAGYQLTRQEGGGATKIYGQLLAAAKKLIDNGNVNGLYFTPAEDAMALMYRKFYEQYLSKEFIQPIKSYYIRRSWLKQKLESLPPNMRQIIYNKILSGNRDIRKGLKDITQKKMNARNEVMAARKYVGKLAGYYQGIKYIPIYVIGLKQGRYGGNSVDCYWLDNVMGRYQLQRGELNISSDSPNMATRLTDVSAVSPEELAKFQELLKGVGV